MFATSQLDLLFRPRSIAVIGASATPGKRGHILISNLQGMGYMGAIYPVNPRYPTMLGLPCYPDLASLPGVPDVAAICLPSSAVPDLIEEAGKAGIRAAAVVSAAFADEGEAGAKLQRAMLDAAERHGIAIMGPNGLGILNRLDKVQYWILRPPGPAYLTAGTPSGVSAIVQSGSTSMGITVDALERGLTFDYVVSAGNQASVDVSDYIDWLLDDPRSPPRVIGAVIEGVGKPDKFRAVAARALRQGVALVVLKAGRTEATQSFIASHTGALVGSAQVADRVLEQCGVIAVNDIDEWLEQVLFLAHGHPPEGGRWCMVTTSGGANALIADIADEIGLPIPSVPAHTVAAMKRIADRPVLNPLDAGGYYDAPARYPTAMLGAATDPELDLVMACLPWLPGADERPHDLFEAALKARAASPKPLMLCNFTVGPVPEAARSRLRAAGLFPLKGCRATLLALKRGLWWSARRREAQGAAVAHPTEAPAGPDPRLPPTAGLVGPAVARVLLEEAGLSLPPSRDVAGADAALAAAQSVGLPVVMKVDHPDLIHKTEIGAVVTGLTRPEAIREAYRRLAEEVIPASGLAGARVIVQRQITRGIELLLAARRDPVFGAYVVVGLGGIHTELLKDFALRPVPIAPADAQAMLRELRGYALLDGYRRGARYDIGALCDAILRLSRFAERLGPRLELLEINPIIALPDGGGAWVADVVLNLSQERDA